MDSHEFGDPNEPTGSSHKEEESGAGSQELAEKFMAIATMHQISDRGAAAMWDFFRATSADMARVVEETRGFASMKKKCLDGIPTVLMDVGYSDGDGEPAVMLAMQSFPYDRFYKVGATEQLNWVLTYIPIKSLLEYHTELHHGVEADRNIDVSMDGVQLDKSSGKSMEVICIRFAECRHVYPILIYIPERRIKRTTRSLWRRILRELKEEGLKIKLVVADAPMRSKLMGMKQHNAIFSCQTCEGRGEIVKPRRNYSYPPNTMKAPRRTLQKCRDIRKNHDNLTLEGQKGLYKYSPLRGSGVNLLRCMPPEWMHLVALGVARKMLSMTFKIDNVRKVIGTNQVELADWQRMSDIWKKTKLPFEWGRRARAFDFGHYKANELKALTIYGFPALLASIPRTKPFRKVRRCWMLMIAVVRALLLPSGVYEDFLRKDNGNYRLKENARRFYKLYAKVFGPGNCTYNTHAFMHLKKHRDICGPLPETSAYPFEDVYGILRSKYKPGTRSVGLQALRGYYLRLKCEHKCQKTPSFRMKDTSMRSDRLVWTYYDERIRIHTVIAVDRKAKLLKCTELEVQDPPSYFMKGLEPTKLGIFAAKYVKLSTRTIPYAAVMGKVIQVHDCLITIGMDSLME